MPGFGFDDDDENDDTPEPPSRPRGGGADRRDKIPALIAAAARTRDDETKLLLLGKAKQIDPSRIEVYLLRAEIYERRGDDQRELLELKEALEADPTSWHARFRVLNLEYPRTRNLAHAAGIIRDLAWQKRLPERLFNSARGTLRSESELGHDEALLGHLVLADRPGHGTVELGAVAAGAGGDVFVLNAHEPWLERFASDGTLIYGIDLWLTEDEDLAQRPADVAAAGDGSALVVEPRAGRVLRFGPEGAYLGTLGARGLPEPCAVATAPGGGVVAVACAGDGSIRRFEIASGKAAGRAAVGASAAAMRAGGLALGRDGTAILLAGDEVYLVPPGAKRESERVALPKAKAAAKAKPAKTAKAAKAAGVPKRAARRGIDADPRDGTLWNVDPGRHAVARLDLATGREVERAGGTDALRFPRDVAVDAAGNLTVADTGNARVVRRPAGGASFTVLIGGEGWRTPK